MKDVSPGNFGVLIAFVLPGFVVLWGMSYFSPTVRLWLSGPNTTPTVGGFMFGTLASVAAGVTVSTVRWLVIDKIHHWTGIRQPPWNFSQLGRNVDAYNVLNDIHYKFYQGHSNGLIALIFVFVARRTHQGFFTAPVGWFDLGLALLSVVLFVGSRDMLRKYYTRVSQLLGTLQSASESDEEAEVASEGIFHELKAGYHSRGMTTKRDHRAGGRRFKKSSRGV
jgi:hypothetical protein